LSRRLGDDPLTRAKGRRAKAVEGQAPVAPDSEGQQGAAQVGIQTASRASYNDVFFQRRGEGIAAPQMSADARAAVEAPEISEISQIPEIREAAVASGSQASFGVTADVKTASEVAQDTQVVPAPPVSIIEDVTAKSNARVASTASTVGPAAEAKGEAASVQTSSQAPAPDGDELKPEPPKSGGFFKRLFGKFK
jgi:hypothetical protein